MKHLTDNEKEEIQIQQNLYEHIEKFNSFRFNSGAGAGKTYALVDVIKYIIKNKFKELENINQQIVCITYTNVAVNEIKERLGNSDLIQISTIHDKLWDIINIHQKELVDLHKEKLQEELNKIVLDLSDKDHKEFHIYASLSDDQKEEFIKFFLETIDVFRKSRDLKAKEFKVQYDQIDNKPSKFSDLIKNVGNFKSLLKSIYKIERYKKCIEDIDNGINKDVKYDSAFNNDMLDYMKFSHDTLLEYSEKLFDKYPLLARIVVDKYPYVFIDEYQDTSKNVIRIMKKLFDSAKKYNKKWLVGYFGDTAQNIYDDGVGGQIDNEHPNISNINKSFNRRSHKQIINVINKIRADDIVQKPIFDNRDKGKVSFVSNPQEDSIDSFLKEYQEELKQDKFLETTQINCLVLTNELVAKLSNFGNIYDIIKDAKSIYYNEIKTKFLSHDIEKLDKTIRLLYNIVKIYDSLHDENATYFNIFGKLKSKISFAQAHKFLEDLKIIQPKTLDDFIIGLSNVIANQEYDHAICLSFLINIGIEEKEIKEFKSLEQYVKCQIINLLFKDEEIELPNDKLNSLANIPLTEWTLWVNFIDRKNDKDPIVYHTYHGTKGEEYENVAIIMQHSFGKTKDKFKKYFLNVAKQSNSLTDKEITELENTKNLLYVACSRAIKNLKVLYIDDIREIEEGIKSIFTAPFLTDNP